MPTIDPIEVQIIAHLQGDAAVLGLINPKSSVLLMQLAQNYPRPNLVLSRVVTNPMYTHDGLDGLAYGRFQIRATAETYASAFALRSAVRFAMSRFIPQGTHSPAKMLMEVPSMEPNQQPPLWSFSTDYGMWFQEQEES